MEVRVATVQLARRAHLFLLPQSNSRVTRALRTSGWRLRHDFAASVELERLEALLLPAAHQTCVQKQRSRALGTRSRKRERESEDWAGYATSLEGLSKSTLRESSNGPRGLRRSVAERRLLSESDRLGAQEGRKRRARSGWSFRKERACGHRSDARLSRARVRERIVHAKMRLDRVSVSRADSDPKGELRAPFDPRVEPHSLLFVSLREAALRTVRAPRHGRVWRATTPAVELSRVLVAVARRTERRSAAPLLLWPRRARRT